MKRLSLLLFCLLFFAACDSTDTECGPGDICAPPPATVFVASQGQFGMDDGGLVVYDPGADRADEVYGDLFVQSVAVRGDRVYLSSLDRVDVLDATSFDRVAQIDVPNPRYFAFDDGKAFVTSLFDEGFDDGGLAVIDLASGQVEETVPIGGNPDGVAVAGGRVYVAGFDFGNGRTVIALDVENYDEIERIEVGCDGPRFLFVDAEEEVVVVCTGLTTFGDDGSVVGQTNGAFVVLDGATGDEIARADLTTPIGTASVGQDASYASGAETVFAVTSGERVVYRFDTARNALGSTLDLGGDPINAVAYDALNDRLYVGRLDADAPFSAEGTVTIHDGSGMQVGSFRAGVIPSHIAFQTGTE